VRGAIRAQAFGFVGFNVTGNALASRDRIALSAATKSPRSAMLISGWMNNTVRKSPSDARESAAVPEGAKPEAATPAANPAADIGSGFSDAAKETIAALLHLIKLMGGELVLNVAGGETERFERAVRSKIEQYTSPTADPAARKSGLAFASHLVEQVLTQLRAQAAVKRSLAKRKGAQRQEPRADDAAPAPSPPKFLN
jgi:hypothetical protein